MTIDEPKLMEMAGHRYCVSRMSDTFALNAALNALRKAHDDPQWARYANPFEQKWAWSDKWNAPWEVEGLLRDLEDRVGVFSAMFGAELDNDLNRHYAGIFRYDPGDHLSVHVDAGIEPRTRMRKHVTAVLYLTEGPPLELWMGTDCTDPQPGVTVVVDRVEAHRGQLVVFENNDFAWHGVPVNEHAGERYVITVSFLSREIEAFHNRRERAFFVPRPNEDWDSETFALRDRRADPQRYAEVYRV